MNIEQNIQLAVTVITAIITLAYLWKTRVIGVNKELLGKYKEDAEHQKGRAEDYKKKYQNSLKRLREMDLQLDMMKVRLAKADERLLTLEGQPYRPHNASLMGETHDQTV
jgi:uncharacterized membrane protein (DUF106 family)